MKAGRREYFWEENFAKFRRKTPKQCKTRSSAARDTWNPGTAAWHCLKQRQHLELQGLHPSRVGCRWFSGRPQVGEGSGRRGSWMLARSTMATPCLRAQWLPQRRLRTGDTPRAFANGRVAQHSVTERALEHQRQAPLGLGVGVPRPS